MSTDNAQPRLLEIALLLGEKYLALSAAKIKLGHAQQDYAARLLVIIPIDGWPGKNEEARTVARQRAEASDETLCHIRAAMRAANDGIHGLEADIEVLSTERRALEWLIRDRMAARLGGRGDPVETGIADDTDSLAQNITDQALEDALEYEGEIPF